MSVDGPIPIRVEATCGALERLADKPSLRQVKLGLVASV